MLLTKDSLDGPGHFPIGLLQLKDMYVKIKSAAKLELQELEGLNNLPNKEREFVVARSMKQDQMVSKDKVAEDFIEGRMDFEKNDYGPPSSNPIHTPKPPH
uniref:Uncharacterized protein n=1 Tax=Chenopodium quinoa TaxID=63459 RepID=A0A803MNE7_CHEQI